MSEAIYQSSAPTGVEITLEDVNSQEVTSLYPLLFFYTTILIVGVLGNALVLLVYSLRYRRSPARVYIVFLAAIDFSMCLFGLPYHLIDMTHPYTYTNASACKTLTFIIVTLFYMSVFGLIVIAVDRYLKICRPLGKVQISYFGKRRACGAAIFAAVLLSWPNIVLYGPSEMESPIGNITGHACFFETSYLETNYPFIYTMSTLFVCIGSTIFLVVSYSLIVRTICTRYKCNRLKLTGKSAFDETTLTEEVCFGNGEPRQKIRYNLNGQNHSKSTEDLYHYKTNSSKCSSVNKSHSDIQSLNRYEERFVMLNSNGSLTFVGEGKNSASSLQKSKMELKKLDDTTQPLLSIAAETSFSVNKFTPKYDIASSSVESRTNDSDLFKRGNKQFSDQNVLSSNLHEGSIKSLYDPRCQLTEPLHKCTELSSMPSVDLIGLRKSGRYSLQVPSAVTPFSKKISFRRTSDLTGANYNKIIQNWKHCSAVALKNNLNQDEGLRIHTSSHSISNISSQGTLKVKKVVSRQHSKITKIMLTITIIFILSYSPALVVTIWTAVQPEFWDILNGRETIICEFFLRFYLVNNVCNPFIYGFWDKRFKREVVYTLRKIMLSLADKWSCCFQKKTGI
ncbi:uncharacterized protein LOC123541432 [Mercenaria mercenaria]|uniref:uncharacterized protein LOC123541432 n=1 Tax=Mercenaria mercenaria TaxID=6596 RepID=UPI00234F44E2|nr:uncharacterized protein LOC123541432 [Mercenaria mercenaria]XP_045182834.2 uncharacterized protein LOC123541432 [Mercenaria mercenaria]XP_045182835.2 uncharacterized protein LOC123541432 [Mercenaria mercenaria]